MKENSPGESIVVSIRTYNRLLRSEKILNALYRGGVDNWEWYGESLADLEEDDEIEDE